MAPCTITAVGDCPAGMTALSPTASTVIVVVQVVAANAGAPTSNAPITAIAVPQPRSRPACLILQARAIIGLF
jgi:hypothetical protein